MAIPFVPRPRGARWMGGTIIILLIAATFIAYLAGFLSCDSRAFFDAGGRRPRYVAILFSGDMGLRLGMGDHIATALQKQGVSVLGVNSPSEFASRKKRPEVDGFVASVIRDALARTHAQQAIVMGQSYGADIARVGLVHLPSALQQRVAAAVLVVPGPTAFFRADPSGLTYRGSPDAGPQEARTLTWLPIVCIKGAAERESLCPWLRSNNVRSITLPGGHFLRQDHVLLTSTITAALSDILRIEPA